MADEDDLYADLYADDSGPIGDQGVDKGYAGDSKDTLSAQSSSSGVGAAPPKSSFIPAAPVAQTSASNGSSFIPPPARNVSKPSTSSFIPPSSHTSYNPIQQSVARTPIETAPMTNSDANRATIVSSVSASSANRPVLPHEMPDEG